MESLTVLRGRTSTAAVSLRWGFFFKRFKDDESSPLVLPPPALQQCKLGELVCEASPGCIPLDKRCDNSADCLPFHTDESSCHGNVLLYALSFKIFSITPPPVDALICQKRPRLRQI